MELTRHRLSMVSINRLIRWVCRRGFSLSWFSSSVIYFVRGSIELVVPMDVSSSDYYLRLGECLGTICEVEGVDVLDLLGEL